MRELSVAEQRYQGRGISRWFLAALENRWSPAERLDAMWDGHCSAGPMFSEGGWGAVPPASLAAVVR
jgi:hypothetical protein